MDLAALQDLLQSLQSNQQQQQQPLPSTLIQSQPALFNHLPPQNQLNSHQSASLIPSHSQSLNHQLPIPSHSTSLPTPSSSLPPSQDIFSLLGALKPISPLPITSTSAPPTLNTSTRPLHPSPADSQSHTPKRQKLDPKSPPQPVAHSNSTQSCPTTDIDGHLELDPGQITLSDALPLLSSLVRNNAFLDAIQLIKERQDELELRLFDERNQIKSAVERNIKKLTLQSDQTSSSNDHKIQKLRNGLKVELNQFDKSCLERWDHLRTQQQVELANLNVPTFCKTKDPVILARQRQVLEIILGAVNERDQKEEQKQEQKQE